MSDSRAEGTRKDESGSALLQAIENFKVVSYCVIPDEKGEIESSLRALSASASGVAVIITVGGTGFSPRDVTPEATRNVIEKHANGVVIALIAGSLPMGAYSRLVAGVRNDTFIVNFPGSVKAVKECWDILCPLLPHITCLMNGEKMVSAG
ncbi:MoCF biosynth domain containing protein [Trichuris trichiura]|uniref:MoCF biosynth domain containing protein n=1 Tax=Trichuris trichiura TaxID=36087 RepID=A0A077ZEL5_TRITR|nr:MoCF biosynth domain containing protein [Trichuris trichiura]